jgi:hypothetical protein
MRTKRGHHSKNPPVPHVAAVVAAPSMDQEGWIDVEDDLPDGPEMVLIFCPHGIERVWLGFFDGDCWRDVSGERLDGMDGPTHWRDRPSGPVRVKGGTR